MTAQLPYQYVVLRAVPRVEREEFLNVGVLMYCEEAGYLDIVWRADRARLGGVFPDLDVDQLCIALEFADAVATGSERAGDAGRAPLGQRFGFLKAPRSTVLQPGPVHGGVTQNPVTELQRLAAVLL